MVTFNKSAQKLFSLTIGAALDDIMKEKEGLITNLCEETLQNSQIVLESETRRKEYYEVSCLPIKKKKKVDGWLVTLHNVSEKVKLNAELIASEEKYRILIERAIDGIIIVQDQEIKFVNPQMTRILGFSEGEFINHSFIDFVAPSERDILFERYSRRIRGENVIPHYETRLLHKEGHEVEVELSSGLIAYEARLGILSFVRDITERKITERALQNQTIELQQRNEDLDAFGHTLAHDLKNSIQIIQGFSEVLLQSEEIQNNEVEEQLEYIYNASLKMGSVIEGLMQLSGLRKKKVTLEPLDMNSVISEVLERLKNLVEGVQINLPAEWHVALGYPPWVEEVWLNYVSNGIKYGGSPPVLTLGSTEKDDQVVFWIQDQGPGLRKEEIESIFRPLVRLNPQTADGHGLGLSIVRRIAGKLGGKAWVESQLGQGSKFCFSLQKPS